MNHALLLNDLLLMEGDLKSLTALFNDLSGLNFAKTKASSWLDKMSASEAYVTYLRIKATEFGIEKWNGKLQLIAPDQRVLRVHLFATHESVVDQHRGKTKSRRNNKTG